MPNTTFEERLAKMRAEAVLPEVGLFRYMHVERLGNEEVEGLLDGEVIVQTKIDGANLTVAWYDEPIGLIVMSRNNVVYRNGAPVEFNVRHKCKECGGSGRIGPNTDCDRCNGGGHDREKTEHRFMDAIEYVLAHDGLKTMAAMGYVLRGEWLLQHSIAYAKDKYQQFYVFDVELRGGGYVHPDVWMPIAKEHGVQFVPVLTRLVRPTADVLADLTKGPDEFGAKQKEGIVVKRYEGWRNKWGRSPWGKMVSADFNLKNKLAMGTTNDDPAEMRFASRVVSYNFIMKTIHKLEEDKGSKLGVRDMPRVLGVVWNDAFREELWDFIKTEKIGPFDFRIVRRLVEQKTRAVALAYFNGVPVIQDQ